jgi:coenzyme Q-binding protein COQ10
MHAEKRLLPYKPEQLFELVAHVERYPEFLPWCVAARVRRREGDEIYADLVIGFRMFRECFTSHVHLQHPDHIDVEYMKGPLRYLNNHWNFEEVEGGCIIDFHVDFEFHSRILEKLVAALFNEAVKHMVNAFEARAHQIYGQPV